jgi:hypothetical protein
VDKLERLGTAVDYEWSHYERAMNYLPDSPAFLTVAGEIMRRRTYGSKRALRRASAQDETVVCAMLAWATAGDGIRQELLEGIGERAWPGPLWSHTN